MRALVWILMIGGAYAGVHSSPAYAQAQDGEEVAIVTRAGVTLRVRTDSWSGEPRRFDKVLPVLVEITNDGEAPLRLRHEDFALVTESGEPVTATPPFDLRGTEIEQVGRPIGDYGFRPYGYAFYPYANRFFPFRSLGYYGPYGYRYSGFDRFRSVRLPTSDMVAQALPESVVDPGGRATGFVYFVDDDDHVDLDHAGQVVFRVALVNAETHGPVATIEIPLLADEDELEIANP